MERRHALIVASLVAVTVSTSAAADGVRASVADPVAGDGRTVVAVEINGNLPNQRKVLPVAEVPTVTCAGAAALPAVADHGPAILAPVVTVATTLSCVAQLRDLKVPVSVRLRPPGAGLYAQGPHAVRIGDPPMRMDVFGWDGTHRTSPDRLHAAASDADATVTERGALTLEVRGKVPRTVVLALVDGSSAGAAFIPVIGVPTLPVEAEAGSKVEVWVAGTWFGPVATNGTVAAVPIEVPPGVTHAVVRSTSSGGYVTDELIDLKIPARPRIAAVAAQPSVGTGEEAMVVIAVAGGDGRPAGVATEVVATAERGRVEPARALGGGLWTARYIAPSSTGSDRLTFEIAGDRDAGTAVLALETRGHATRIEVDLPTQIDRGAELTANVRVVDDGGTVLGDPELSATLGGVPLEVVRGAGLLIRGRVPSRVPASGVIALSITSGGAHAVFDVKITPLPTVAGARGRIGAWVSGGWADNLGAWSSPRATLGLGLRRSFGPIEAALLVGVDAMSSRETLALEVNGAMATATRSIRAAGVPIALRGRFPRTGRFGVAVSAAVVPWLARVAVAPAAGTSDAYTEGVLGVRAQISGDVMIGPGRALLGVAVGRASLDRATATGQIDGFALTAGYEWWFGARP